MSGCKVFDFFMFFKKILIRKRIFEGGKLLVYISLFWAPFIPEFMFSIILRFFSNKMYFFIQHFCFVLAVLAMCFCSQCFCSQIQEESLNHNCFVVLMTWIVKNHLAWEHATQPFSFHPNSKSNINRVRSYWWGSSTWWSRWQCRMCWGPVLGKREGVAPIIKKSSKSKLVKAVRVLVVPPTARFVVVRIRIVVE